MYLLYLLHKITKYYFLNIEYCNNYIDIEPTTYSIDIEHRLQETAV